ncbi:divergent polysaccharide deacetylase family protein [Reinekea blandensis]|uniref:Divergent polysaccharide deacetylase family protein n=1 Tax=Reinekea blandensis MED297 TaxID=314283 RepID=A4BE97_9GAMM|nr:divergent polysaccharide deacetylase family protein [Reinekea blandensis]EAR09575.1 hypothetical protein MED297_12627 [Reinekea blandensis MED297]
MILALCRLSRAGLAFILLIGTSDALASGRLVLVMDDLGNQYRLGLDAIALPSVTTVAIMPGRPYTRELAEYAHSLGKEVIIHAPMANLTDFPLGPMGLTREKGPESLLKNLRDAIDSVPYAVGLSNHMGSRLTQDGEAMGWIMQELKRQNLYFFDSKTIASSIAWQVAQNHFIPWSSRQVFLDHYQTEAFIASQWRLALAQVDQGQTVTVIAHPYPETLAFFQNRREMTQDTAFSVPLSHVLNYPVMTSRRTQNIPEGI